MVPLSKKVQLTRKQSAARLRVLQEGWQARRGTQSGTSGRRSLHVRARALRRTTSQRPLPSFSPVCCHAAARCGAALAACQPHAYRRRRVSRLRTRQRWHTRREPQSKL